MTIICQRCFNSRAIGVINGLEVCLSCFDGIEKERKQYKEKVLESIYNEPAHYHKYEIDTIDFLQKGFHPRVFIGFAVGSAVKYIHRYEEKNGMEDLLKAEDYIKRLIAFHKENPST